MQLYQPINEEERSETEQNPVEKIGNPPSFGESQGIIRRKENLGEETGKGTEEIRRDHIVFFKINTNLLCLCDKVFTLARVRHASLTTRKLPEGQK